MYSIKISFFLNKSNPKTKTRMILRRIAPPMLTLKALTMQQSKIFYCRFYSFATSPGLFNVYLKNFEKCFFTKRKFFFTILVCQLFRETYIPAGKLSKHLQKTRISIYIF